MTDLSPAAQAVLDAYQLAPIEDEITAAAVLRAAADQVVPFPGRYPINEYMEGTRDAKQDVHAALFAIAAELEQFSERVKTE